MFSHDVGRQLELGLREDCNQHIVPLYWRYRKDNWRKVAYTTEVASHMIDEFFSSRRTVEAETLM